MEINIFLGTLFLIISRILLLHFDSFFSFSLFRAQNGIFVDTRTSHRSLKKYGKLFPHSDEHCCRKICTDFCLFDYACCSQYVVLP
jgi:hypothetical protein